MLRLCVLGFALALWNCRPVAANPAEPSAATEDAIIQNIWALRDPHSEIRAAAARALRQCAAQHKDGTLGLSAFDHSEAYWKDRISQVKAGMSREQILELLPALPDIICPWFFPTLTVGSMDDAYVCWQLDYHWLIEVTFRHKSRFQTELVLPLELRHKEILVPVSPPKNYTGVWIEWYVNGQKGVEKHYKDGGYHGLITNYYDNSQKQSEQLYTDEGFSGTEFGWYRDGKLEHRGQYANGMKEGLWVYRNADGKMLEPILYKHDNIVDP